MWNGTDWWNQADIEAKEMLCEHLGWPKEWAEGGADLEWLTRGQLKKLAAVDLKVLDEIDAAYNAAMDAKEEE